MSKSAFRALRARLAGEQPKRNPRKHPILSGAVPLVDYKPKPWRYGSQQG